jgi:hypothetical protein
MLPSTLLLAVAYVSGVVALTGFGFFIARIAGDPAGSALGLIVGVSSAIAWALSTIADPEWNVRLNLFAALFAACSLGFVAPVDKLCSWHPIPLLCR